MSVTWLHHEPRTSCDLIERMLHLPITMHMLDEP